MFLFFLDSFLALWEISKLLENNFLKLFWKIEYFNNIEFKEKTCKFDVTKKVAMMYFSLKEPLFI